MIRGAQLEENESFLRQLTLSASPVINAASPEARKATAAGVSFGLPTLPNRMCSEIWAR